jgi:hypothetical protein
MALATVVIIGIGKPQASDETDDEDQPQATDSGFASETPSTRGARRGW